MAQKTSINIKPCNTGSSEAHNRRTAEYLANIVKGNLYIRTDLMARNEVWVAPDFGDTSLTDRYNQIAAMVKEKTGRAMQTKDREKVNKKTGRVTIVRGSTPLKEGVVVIKEDTSMKQLQRFCEVCKERWGITALQVFIHRDEGHYENPQDTATWKPNLHAHIVWDWMNHDTGKSCKLDENAMSEMQTLLAECLEMERGISKAETGKNHLERTDFILAKQKEEAEQVKFEKEAAEADRNAAVRETDKARSEHEKLQSGNEEMQRRSAELDSEIAEKEERAREIDRENTDSIKSGIANLFGKGKYAAIEQENAKLKAENEHIKESFPDAIRKEVAKRTKALTDAKRTVELERDSAMARADTFESERDTALRQLREQKTGEQHRISMAVSRATEEKDKTIKRLQGTLKTSQDILNVIADILYKASEVFRRAIDAIIRFATEKYKSIFSNDEAADIKSVMQSYGETTEQQKAVGAWLCDYAEHLQPFEEIKHRHTLNEVGDVAEGRYDWKIERGQGRSLL